MDTPITPTTSQAAPPTPFLALLAIAIFVCFHFGDVLFGSRTLNTLPYSPAAQPYQIPPSGGSMAGTFIDRFPAGMTADRAFWDRPMVYDPNFLATHRALKAGEFPWLNPSLALGAPLFANGVDGTFFVGNLLMAFVNNWYWDYVYLGLYLLSGWMIHSVLYRSFAFSSMASLVGTLVYLSSGLFVPQLGYGGEIWNIHIFGWCLFFLEKFLHSKTLLQRSVAAVLLSLSLSQSCYCGMPEGTVAVFCMIGLLFLVRAVNTDNLFLASSKKLCRLNLGILSWGFFIFSSALLVASPYLVTLFYYSTMMPHGHEVGGLGLPMRLLPDLFIPYLHGWELHHFFGPELAGKVNVVFVGALPLVAGLLLLTRSMRPARRGLEVSLFVGIVVWYLTQSFTTATINLNFIGALPVLNKVFFFRFFAPLFVFGCAYLVSAGTSTFLSDRTSVLSWRTILSIWALFIATTFWIKREGLSVIPGTAPLGGTDSFFEWNSLHSVFLAGIGCWLTLDKLIGQFTSCSPARLRSLILIVVALWSTNNQFSKSFFSRQDIAASTPFIDFLQQKSSDSRPIRIYSHDLLFPGTSSSYGLEDIRHMNPVVPSNFASFISALFGDLAHGKVSWERFEKLHEIGGASSYSHPGFDLLNVRFLVFAPGSPHIPIGSQFEEVFRDAQAVVVRNRDAKPRVWISDKFSVLSSDEEVLQTLRIDPTRSLHDVLLSSNPTWNFVPGGQKVTQSKVKILTRTNSSYRLEVKLPKNEVLVIGDLLHPGHTALAVPLNGNSKVELPILKANGGLIGIAAPRGEYRLEVRYSPPVATLSGGLLLLGLVVMIGFPLIVLCTKREALPTSNK